MHVSSYPTAPVDILIAEDDAPMRTGLRLLLEQQGYYCLEARNGREAVDMARLSPPRCVLLDLAMPELDGFAVARQLRADPRTRTAHIHCITGRTEEGVREQARQAGCEEFLPKPVDISTLLQVVKPQVDLNKVPPSSVLDLVEAEDLLDWISANGLGPAKVVYDPDRGFTVQPANCVSQPDDTSVSDQSLPEKGV